MKKTMLSVLALAFSATGGIGAFRLTDLPANGDCRPQWRTVAGFVIPTCAGDCIGYANNMEYCCLRSEIDGDSDIQIHRCICKNTECSTPGQWVDINNACSGKISIDWRTGMLSGSTTCVMDNPTSCPNGQAPPKKCKPEDAPPPNTADDVCKCRQ